MGKLHRNAQISLAAIFLVPLILSTIGLSIYGSMSEELYLNSLYSQGEIVILNDNDFADRYSLPGSGTTEDPFRVENQCFEDTSTTAIVIRDTTKHFIIRNCSIKKRGQSLYISNIGFNTGKLINNTFTNDLTLGSAQRFVDFREEGWFTYPDFYASYAKGFTYIRDAPGIIIEKNIFQYSSEDTVKFYDNGLVILSSAFSVINNNTISFFYYGILAYDSLYINIENNFCINNYNGIYIQSIQESFIMNNICTKNTNGLEVYYSENVFIFENNLSYNTEVGLYSRSEATSFQIKGNYIEGNEFGLLGKFENCNITYNTFSLNTNYSIKLDKYYYANFNNIHHNIFNNNNYEGLILGQKQAFDDHEDEDDQNYWYDNSSKEGNYWSELIWYVDCVYQIDGGTAIDQYPVQVPPTLELWEELL